MQDHRELGQRTSADFDPTTRNNVNDRNQSFQLPSYSLVDLHLGYAFQLSNYNLYAGLSCFNLFDKEYILRGTDGANHQLSDFQGYWGFGRTFNVNFKVNF